MITLIQLGGCVIVGAYFIMLGMGVKIEPAKLRGHKAFVGLGILIIFLGAALLAMEQRLSELPLQMAPKDIVAGIREKLNPPVQLDAMTRLMSVDSGDDRIILHFALTAHDEAEFDRQIAMLREHMQKNGCTTPDNKRLLMSGIALEMRYAMTNGDKTTEPIILTPKACGY